MRDTSCSKEERLGNQIIKKIEFYQKSLIEKRSLEEKLDFFNTQYEEADRFSKITELYGKKQKLDKEMNYQLDRIRINFQKLVVDTGHPEYQKEVYKEIDIAPKLDFLRKIVEEILKK